MAKTVLGGIVYRNNQTRKEAAEVEKIDFPTIAPAATVTVGSQGTMYLKNPPPVIGHYDFHDVLYYEDSNHHNDATLQVDSNIGPSKYAVTRTA